MLKLSLAGVSLSLMVAAAAAADLPARTTAPAPSLEVEAPNWDGLYLGVTGAHSLGNVAFKLQDVLQLDGFGTIGPAVGLVAGYNKTFDNRWLLGLELSGELSANAARASFVSGVGALRTKALSDWDASISTRFGYLVSPRTLVYSSVGATVVHGKGSFTLSESGYSIGDTAKDYFYGVAFAGLGIETQLSGGWRGRFEYGASLLRTNVYRDTLKIEVSPQIGTAKLGLVYGFGGKTTVAKQEKDPPSWTGFYVGGGFGRNHSISRYDLGLAYSHLTVDGLGAQGVSGSGFVGYNYQINNQFVVGAEAVGTISTSKDRYLLEPNGIINMVPDGTGLVGRNKDWWTARLRGGYLIAPETMAYATIGYSKVRSELKAVGSMLVGSGLLEKYNRDAVEFGGGVETWVTDKISMRVEYSYADLERAAVFKEAPAFGTLKHRQSTGLAAAAYHF